MTKHAGEGAEHTLESVSSQHTVYADTDIYGLREEFVGELNSPVTRWLNKVLMVNSTVPVSSPTGAARWRPRTLPARHFWSRCATFGHVRPCGLSEQRGAVPARSGFGQFAAFERVHGRRTNRARG
eukprot:8642520-Pyramimonas_sp.AAC.2